MQRERSLTGIRFQSTCLREARRRRSLRRPLPRNFNPRAYVRHDVRRIICLSMVRFQSTCLREARLGHHFLQALRAISIHVPT